MRRKYFLLLCILACASVGAQKNISRPLIVISGNGITRNVGSDEFYRIYSKNNSVAAEARKNIHEYLDLFINFKLKVTEAERLGYDTVSAFIKEFKGYRDQLAKPYLTDTVLRNALIDESYRRMQTDIRVSHILVRVDFTSATPADTLAAFKKIVAARKRILAGEDFAKVAAEVSEDTYANKNGGDIGFFTVFKFPYTFESAAYNTPPGKISGPVKTTFGYHLIKVTDTRKALGRIKVAHIMKVTPENMTPQQSDSVKQIVWTIMEKIKAGADFAAMADSFSDDRRSASNGGELPMFGVGQMIPEFENACFELKNNGDISAEPLRTMYGWHIIKRLDRQEIEPFEKSKPVIEAAISRGDRAEHLKNLYLQKLKTMNKMKVVTSALSVFYNLDTAVLTGHNKLSVAALSKPLIVFPSRTYLQSDFAAYLAEHPLKTNAGKSAIPGYIDKQFTAFTHAKVMEYEDAQLEKRNAPFRELLSEYHDGILLFNIMDEKVWSRAVKDTLGLKEFYESNKDKYRWGDRMDAVLFTCSGREIAEVAHAMAETGLTADELVRKACITTPAKDTITFEQGKFSREDDPIIALLEWKTGWSGLIEKDGKTYFALVNALLPPEPKTLEEARGQVISDYQDFLEKQWISELKTVYSVKVDQQLLDALAKK